MYACANLRCVLLLALTVCCGGSYLLEQPASSLMGEFFRFKAFTEATRVTWFLWWIVIKFLHTFKSLFHICCKMKSSYISFCVYITIWKQYIYSIFHIHPATLLKTTSSNPRASLHCQGILCEVVYGKLWSPLGKTIEGLDEQQEIWAH